MISVFSNTLGDEELAAIEAVLETRWLGKGEQCTLFEKELARHLNTTRVLLLNNCTAAIYVGLRALGVGPGDEVIIPTINFVACANAVIDLGARPVFADVDPHTLNLLPGEIERLKTKRTRAVFLLHYGGHPCDVAGIWNACHGLDVVEDCANAVASTYSGLACGTLGSMGVWSFDAMKELVMVDGGALWLRDEEAYERATSYRYLGLAPKVTSGMDSMTEGNARWWEYDLVATSGRFISNDVLAAIGRVQLWKLPGFIARRKEIWEWYQAGFADVPGLMRPPKPLPDTTSSYYLYWIRTERRDELAAYLAENGIYTTFRYFPLHLVKYYGATCRLPTAERANETTLNLPLHQNLSNEEVDKIITLVGRFVR